METLFVKSRVRCARCKDIKEYSEDMICWRCQRKGNKEIAQAIAAVQSIAAKDAYFLGYAPLSGAIAKLSSDGTEEQR